MTRLGEWIVALVIILAVGAILVFLPVVPAPKPDPAVAALVERVHLLEEKQAALELRAWKLESDLLATRADVAILGARVQAIERVVPVQAIRDRAAQR